jgi:hypothetical protein
MGRKIYIRDIEKKRCEVYNCRLLIDSGVSTAYCTDHAPEHEARKEIEEKRKSKRKAPDYRPLQ